MIYFKKKPHTTLSPVYCSYGRFCPVVYISLSGLMPGEAGWLIALRVSMNRINLHTICIFIHLFIYSFIEVIYSFINSWLTHKLSSLSLSFGIFSFFLIFLFALYLSLSVSFALCIYVCLFLRISFCLFSL